MVHYYSELPNSRGAYPSRAMNQEVWDSLPADIQEIFDSNTEWLSERTLELAQVAEEKGLHFVFNGPDSGLVVDVKRGAVVCGDLRYDGKETFLEGIGHRHGVLLLVKAVFRT